MRENIFSTGNALVLSGAGAIYGLQISPPGGDTSGSGIDQSHLVDLNADATANTAFKGGYGDISVYRCCECLKITDERAECTALTNSFTWSFCITNTGTLTNGHYVFIDLPPGVTVSPRIIDLNPLVLPGQGICTNVTFTIDPAFKTNELCFRLAAHTPDYATCCIVTKCVKVPECCAAIVKESLKCDPVTGQMSWTFQIQNTSGSTVSYLDRGAGTRRLRLRDPARHYSRPPPPQRTVHQPHRDALGDQQSLRSGVLPTVIA